MARLATATTVLLALTALASLVLLLAGNVNYAAEVAGFIPGRLSGTVASGFRDAIGYYPFWITPITATLIHAGLLHLALNMGMLFVTGMATERAVGSGGLVLLYVVGAYAAAAGQWLWDPASPIPVVGASGAVSAVFGAYALLFGRSKARAIGPIPAHVVSVVWLVATWVLLNVALVQLTSAGGQYPIAGAAHIGGFLAGLALAHPLARRRWRVA